MATPTGQIGLYDVRAELNRGGQISLGDGDVRQLAGRPSGQIAMSDLRGKSNYITVTSGRGEKGVNTYFGFARDNPLFSGINIGSVTTQSFSGGTLYGIWTSYYIDWSANKLLIMNIDFGNSVVVEINGVRYTFNRYNIVGGVHHYENYDRNLTYLLRDTGKAGSTFTIKKV